MKIFNSTLVVLLVVLLNGCSTINEDIPLIIYNQADPYIANFETQIFEEANGKFKVVSYDSQNSQIIQNELIENIINNDPQILIVNPVDRLGAYTVIQLAKENDIPVIFFNREPLEEDLSTWNYAFYVGALDEDSAVIQAEMVKELFGDDPDNLSDLDKNGDNVIQLVLLKGEQGHQAAEKRTTKIISELEQFGYELDILALEVCDWNREIAYDFMNEFIPDYKDSIELVISNNDAMSLGAIDAMIDYEMFVDLNEDGVYERENDIWIPVVGIDALDEAGPYLLNGTLYGTVLNDSVTMAKAIVELAMALLNDEDPNSINFDVIDNNYIWVEYQRYDMTESED